MTPLREQTTNLIINLENDDDILLDDSATLASVGIGASRSSSAPSLLSSSLADPALDVHVRRARGRDQLLQRQAVRGVQERPRAEVVSEEEKDDDDARTFARIFWALEVSHTVL